MPHAETMPNGTQATTNGEKPHSHFFSHLASYPIVSDSIKVYKSTYPGALTLNLAHSTTARLQPLEPYARTPISYLTPYLSAADNLGDSSLQSLDKTFPILTKDTQTVKRTVVGYATAPVVVPLGWAQDGRAYVGRVYGREWQNVGGGGDRQTRGPLRMGKALVGTGLSVVGDVVGWAHEWVVRGEREMGVRARAAKERAQEQGGALGERAAEVVQEVREKVGQGAEEAKAEAKESKGSAKQSAKETKDQAYEKKEQAKEKANEKKENGSVKA